MLTYKTDFLFQTFLIVSIVLYLWKSLKKSATMKNVLLLLCGFLGLSGCHAAQDGDTIDNSTVSVFDVRRFMGKWYEIARYDHRFEKGMTHVTATYSLQENGSIKVKNEGYKNGKHKEVEGRAKQPNPADPGKLKVSFFLWFYSDYYVLDIDPDYRYVLIGSSSDKYLWIMSRDKTLSKEKQAELLDKLRVRGYDTEKLLFVDQN